MPHTEDGIPIVTGTPLTAYKELNEKDRPQRGDILVTKGWFDWPNGYR
jgi:hypothetical protein